MENKVKMPVSIYAEMTPNPAVMKFVANMRLIESDHIEFKNIEEAKPSPLAVKLFHLPFVKEVFISSNYIAITKYDIVDWEEITMELREMIREYFASGEMAVRIQDLPSSGTAESESIPLINAHPEEKLAVDYDEIEKKIVSILEEYVQPAVEQDGGNIKFLNYNSGEVKVLLQGACSGCPSSTMTLKQGIHNLLNQMLPGEVKEVTAVNG